jgi:hypothetical protein
MANHRLASDQRYVQRPVTAHQFEHAFDQGITTLIAKFAQGGFSTQMAVAIGVTARAA